MPTPRPIMIPRNVVKSGTGRTLVSRVTLIDTPMPMPNKQRVADGQPDREHRPNARIRMMIANARPSTSDEGGSNAAKT